MTHRSEVVSTSRHGTRPGLTSALIFSLSPCAAAAVIWKVLADVACAGRAPPCQLPHLERLRFGKPSGEEEGFFSMPAYMTKSSVGPAEEGAPPQKRARTNPPLRLVLRDTNRSRIEGNPPKIPDKFYSAAHFAALGLNLFEANGTGGVNSYVGGCR